MQPEKDSFGGQIKEAERIAYLIAGFLQKTLTEEEHDELDAWVVASEDNMKMFEELTDPDNIEAGIAQYKRIEENKALENIKVELGLNNRSLFRKIFPYLGAAVFLAAILLFIFIRKEHTPEQISETSSAINGGREQAVLTLSNGRTLILDSTKKGLLTNDGAVHINIGGEGEIIYSNGDVDALRYNMVSTPRGGTYKVVLSDGTVVWLNAESSIKFPAAFTSEVREVSILGEAYFEVSKGGRRAPWPFQVKFTSSDGKEGLIEVLGTSFNVNCYGDNGLVKASLEEGRVKVKLGNEEAILRPGQKAEMRGGLKIMEADLQKETGWRKRLFVFRDERIETIGAEIARWYDVEVVYEGKIDYHFNATIDRNEPLEEVLKMLEKTQRVGFNLEGKKLTIRP